LNWKRAPSKKRSLVPVSGDVNKEKLPVAIPLPEKTNSLGSLIPHARAVCALVVTMIEAAFGAAAMARTGGAGRLAARRPATRLRAVRVTAITRREMAKRPLQRRQTFW